MHDHYTNIAHKVRPWRDTDLMFYQAMLVKHTDVDAPAVRNRCGQISTPMVSRVSLEINVPRFLTVTPDCSSSYPLVLPQDNNFQATLGLTTSGSTSRSGFDAARMDTHSRSNLCGGTLRMPENENKRGVCPFKSQGQNPLFYVNGGCAP
jgi:hypothetical protein